MQWNIKLNQLLIKIYEEDVRLECESSYKGDKQPKKNIGCLFNPHQHPST